MSGDLAELRGRLLLLQKECQSIGQLPPRPPTLRASLGGIFVSLMRRLMFWYTPSLQRSIGGLIQALEDTLQILETLQDQVRPRVTGLESRIATLEASLQELVYALQVERVSTIDLENSVDQVQPRIAGLEGRISTLEAGLQEQAHALQRERVSTIDLENGIREQADAVQQFQEDRLAREEALVKRLESAEERLQRMRQEIAEQSLQVSRLLEEAGRRR